MSGRGTSAEARRVEGWTEELTAVAGLIGRRFGRAEPRRRAVGYVRALLGDADRKNGWQLAEAIGEPNPDGVQHLLARADWDADAVRDDLVRYVAEQMGDLGGVLVVDETGFLKKGAKSVGVARQYSGTAGRIENCQVGVFLGYATTRGRVLVDRSLMGSATLAGRRPRLVPLAAGPPAPRPSLSLPLPRGPTADLSNYGCKTRTEPYSGFRGGVE